MNTADQTYVDIVNKCWEDDNFKQRFIQSPNETLAETFNKKFVSDNGKGIVVVDQTDSEVININIMPPPDIDNLELTDEQLEQVAGGFSPALASSYWCLAGVSAVVGFAVAAID